MDHEILVSNTKKVALGALENLRTCDHATAYAMHGRVAQVSGHIGVDLSDTDVEAVLRVLVGMSLVTPGVHFSLWHDGPWVGVCAGYTDEKVHDSARLALEVNHFDATLVWDYSQWYGLYRTRVGHYVVTVYSNIGGWTVHIAHDNPAKNPGWLSETAMFPSDKAAKRAAAEWLFTHTNGGTQ